MFSKEQATQQALTHVFGVEAALRDGNARAAHIIAQDLLRVTESLALDPAYSGE